jgi:tetratricopeptide (TPR) repeat protein
VLRNSPKRPPQSPHPRPVGDRSPFPSRVRPVPRTPSRRLARGVQRRRPPAHPDRRQLLWIASDYILLKDLADPERSLLFATAYYPADPALWYLLGRTEYNQDHNADAAHAFPCAIELRPRDVRVEYNLGLTFERLGRTADAISAYQTAINWQSNLPQPDPQPYPDLGSLFLLREGKHAEALDALGQALRFGRRNPLAHQQLGLALEALGRDQEAIASLQQAAALAPTAEQPHFFLGRIFRRLGRSSDSAREYAAAAKLLGSHSDVATPNADSQSELPSNQP